MQLTQPQMHVVGRGIRELHQEVVEGGDGFGETAVALVSHAQPIQNQQLLGNTVTRLKLPGGGEIVHRCGEIAVVQLGFRQGEAHFRSRGWRG